MPVRSGPIFVPSPPCMWHLAHCFLKTTLPATASPVCSRQRQQLVEHLLPVGIGQAAAALQQSPRAAGDAAGRDARPAPASGRATGRPAARCPRRARRASASVHSARLEQHAQRRGAGRRRRASASSARSAAPAAGRLAGAQRLDQARGQLRRRARRDQLEQLFDGLRRRSRGTRRTAGPPPCARRRQADSSSTAVASNAAAISAPCFANCLAAPASWPGATSCPLPAGEQPRRAAASRSCSRLVGRACGWFARPAPGQAADDRVGHWRLDAPDD